MFERGKSDPAAAQMTVTVAAEIALDDGQYLKGKFIIATSRGFLEVLNGPAAFLEFEPYTGERILIAKTALRSVKLVPVPAAVNPNTRLREHDGFDPYTTLGVARGAAWDDVRQAYHRLAKTYHPDRYSNAELPAEVRDYLSAMVRRINAAYAALEVPVQVAKLVASERSEPVYTSRPRA